VLLGCAAGGNGRPLGRAVPSSNLLLCDKVPSSPFWRLFKIAHFAKRWSSPGRNSPGTTEFKDREILGHQRALFRKGWAFGALFLGPRFSLDRGVTGLTGRWAWRVIVAQQDIQQ